MSNWGWKKPSSTATNSFGKWNIEPRLVGGLGFEALSIIYCPFVDLEVHGRFYLVCLSLNIRVGATREGGVKGMIFILNPNP